MRIFNTDLLVLRHEFMNSMEFPDAYEGVTFALSISRCDTCCPLNLFAHNSRVRATFTNCLHAVFAIQPLVLFSKSRPGTSIIKKKKQ
jgi:hypothetical protein